jgi:hypothetical protein
MGKYTITPERYLELSRIAKKITDILIEESITAPEVCAIGDITKSFLKAAGKITDSQ